jgi:4-hydroxymandelate oxidase
MTYNAITPTPPVNLREFEAAAAVLLPSMVYDYYAGGANDEALLTATSDAWESIRIRHRVLRDVSHRSLACASLGQTLEWPVIIAPMSFQQLAHADGELATARAARRSGTGMVLSTLSNTPVEDVAAIAPHPLWFQLYIEKDRGATAGAARRACGVSRACADR